MARVIVILLVVVGVIVGAAKFFYSMHPKAQAGTVTGKQPWAYGYMQFTAWDGEQWTAWIHDGQFVLVPENTDDWSRRTSPIVAFFNWQGQPWQAKLDGDRFLLAHRGNWKGPVESQEALHYRDWGGEPRLRTVEQLRR